MIPTATVQPAAPSGESPTLIVSRTFGTVVLALHGEIEGSGPPYLGAVLHDLIDGQGNLALVVDLGAARGLDHSVVEVLSAAARSMNRRGGWLRLARPSQAVTRALTAGELAHLTVDPGGQCCRSPGVSNAGVARATGGAATGLKRETTSVPTGEVTP